MSSLRQKPINDTDNGAVLHATAGSAASHPPSRGATSLPRRSDFQSCWVVGLVALAVSGCVSKSKSRLDAERAYMEGQQRVLAEQSAQQPVVWFRGDIRNPRVPWTEGLSLAQALLAAQYTWNWDPRFITVTRNGETHPINPKRLLRGEEDPVLEPGDVIEIRH